MTKLYTHILYDALGFKFTDGLMSCIDLFKTLYFMLSTYVNLLHSSTYQSLYTYDLS
jgi:hypothetical protein